MILVNKQVYLTLNGLNYFFKNNLEFIESNDYKIIVESVKCYGKKYYNVKVLRYNKKGE